ncbi:MAG: cytochrome c3 family protein [Desulfosalsimonadaceae bacterium]
MSEKIRLTGGLILLMLLAVSICPAHAQEDITQVADSAFEAPMRPPVAFHHDAHNEKAGIDDCSICHHAYENGEKQEDDDSVGMECSECHLKKDQNNPIGLIQAYHRQCTGCHADRKAGPVMCGECHRKR